MTRALSVNAAGLCAAAMLATPAAALVRRPIADAQKVLSQPSYERQAQQGLPQSKAPLWAVLRRTQIGEDDKRGTFTAAFPPEVRALNGRTVTLSGFMLPLDTDAKARHFLLSKYTPVCFFCPPGQPNEVVEVVAAAGVPVTDRMLNVTGRLTLTNEADKGLFFRLDQAVAR